MNLRRRPVPRSPTARPRMVLDCPVRAVHQLAARVVSPRQLAAHVQLPVCRAMRAICHGCPQRCPRRCVVQGPANSQQMCWSSVLQRPRDRTGTQTRVRTRAVRRRTVAHCGRRRGRDAGVSCRLASPSLPSLWQGPRIDALFAPECSAGPRPPQFHRLRS